MTKTDKAMKVIISWLGACKIPYSLLDKNNIQITAKDTNTHIFSVTEENAVLFLDTNISKALSAFKELIESYGYTNITPVNRGESNPSKASYKTDFDLVVMRHMEFRAAPNPSPESLQYFSKVVDIASKNFYNKNKYNCQLNGLEIEDLKQYALIWTVNFIHKYKIINPEGTENERLLMAHLKQRFYEFFQLLSKKEKNIVPELETIRIGLYNDKESSNIVNEHSTAKMVFQNEDGEGQTTPFFYDPRIEAEEEYDTDRCELDRRSPGLRKKSATQLLKKLLNELPLEKRIEKLKEVVDNSFTSVEAKKTAIRYLRANGIELGDSNIDKDTGGDDAPSV